jgi:hypothetical protein
MGIYDNKIKLTAKETVWLTNFLTNKKGEIDFVGLPAEIRKVDSVIGTRVAKKIDSEVLTCTYALIEKLGL